MNKIKNKYNNIKKIAEAVRDNGIIYDEYRYTHINYVVKLCNILNCNSKNAEIKQGWIIDINNNFKIKPYLYIIYSNGKDNIYIDIIGGCNGESVSMTTKLQPWIYKRKPSIDKVKHMMEKYSTLEMCKTYELYN